VSKLSCGEVRNLREIRRRSHLRSTGTKVPVRMILCAKIGSVEINEPIEMKIGGQRIITKDFDKKGKPLTLSIISDGNLLSLDETLHRDIR